jgi:hypothetical protein
MVQTLSKHTSRHEDLNLMSANQDGIYRLTTIEIATAHKKDHQIYSKNMPKHQKLICVFNLLKTKWAQGAIVIVVG